MSHPFNDNRLNEWYMDILLFTTEIQQSDLTRLNSFLERTAGIVRWTIDLDDCDHVLRIVSYGLCPKRLQDHLNQAGFKCLPMT